MLFHCPSRSCHHRSEHRGPRRRILRIPRSRAWACRRSVRSVGPGSKPLFTCWSRHVKTPKQGVTQVRRESNLDSIPRDQSTSQKMIGDTLMCWGVQVPSEKVLGSVCWLRPHKTTLQSIKVSSTVQSVQSLIQAEPLFCRRNP